VKDTVFVSRNQAMQEYNSQYDDPSLFEDILPRCSATGISFISEDITEMKETKSALRR
jgi:hypothetical protein